MSRALRRTGILGLALACALAGRGAPAAAQDTDRQALAVQLARLLLDEPVRRGIDEQVTGRLARVIGTLLEERLNRRLQDIEIKTLLGIVRSFVGRALTPGLTEQIAARSYASHFDAEELRLLLAFQTSAVGQKAARLTPVIGLETAQAIEAEIQQSPAMPRMLEELQRAFPVLRSPESP